MASKEMDMARKIKALRQEQGLTLDQVAQVVGVGKSTVRKWETGMIANMKRDKIAALAKALHTTPAYLMGWDDSKEEEKTSSPSKEDLTEEEKILLDLFNRVPEDKQKLVIQMIRVALGNPK